MGRHHIDLWQHFTDGYRLEGSPFYGTVNCDFNSSTDEKVSKKYYVKLEQFADRFDKPLALYKLHGSIYNTIVYRPGFNQQRIHIKDNYAVSGFFKEVTDEKTKEVKFEYLFNDVAPDFLSGTLSKPRLYDIDPYYKNLFEHFKNNLSASELLVVIGYGFQDPRINEYLEEHFLAKEKQMIVIDPSKPRTDLLEKYKVTYIPKGVTQVSSHEYLELIPEELKKKN